MAKTTKELAKQWQPKIVTIDLPLSPAQIDQTEAELAAKAASDIDKCRGYFPGMGDRAGIDVDLPQSQSFATQLAVLPVDGKALQFNFLRLSLVDQPSISPFHLDNDSATALTGDAATISNRLVWRLLLNLSSQKSRTVIYLNLDPSSVELKADRGYIAYPNRTVDEALVKEAKLAPREGSRVQGVLFCASRVLHAGKDMDGGHFVAGYGMDEAA